MSLTQESKALRVLDWVLTLPGSAVHSGVHVRCDAWGGLGIFMRPGHPSSIAKGEQILSIPRTAMLECIASTPPHMRQAALALRLLSEMSKGKASAWAPYIACLPSATAGLSHMPLLWHLEELQGRDCVGNHAHQQQQPIQQAAKSSTQQTLVEELLQASPGATSAFKALWAKVKEEYSQLPELQQQVGDVTTPVPTWPAYVWARCIVMSRAIHLWSGPTLVPLVDFLNHCKPPNVVCRCHTDLSSDSRSIYSPPSTPSSADSHGDDASNDNGAQAAAVQAFVCEAVRDIQPGEELLWVYNAHTADADWLMGYGCVPCDGSSIPAGCEGPGADMEPPVEQHHQQQQEIRQRHAESVDRALQRIASLPPDARGRAACIEVLLQRERADIAS